jgi:hypothetical protein
LQQDGLESVETAYAFGIFSIRGDNRAAAQRNAYLGEAAAKRASSNRS